MTNEIHSERDRLDVRTIVLVGAAGLLITAASIWLAWILLPPRREFTPPPPMPQASAPVSSQVRQTLILRDREGVRRREEARAELDRYRWADRKQGLVRIPIRRAMELRAQQKGEAP